MKLRCPRCHNIVKVSSGKDAEMSSFFPFCSERCKLIDLGAWLEEHYKLVSDPSDSKDEYS